MTTVAVWTSSAETDAARARRAWDCVDRMVLKAVSDGPFHEVDQLAARLPYGISLHTIEVALEVLASDGLIRRAVKGHKATLELVMVHEITEAGRTVLDGRDEYRKAA